MLKSSLLIPNSNCQYIILLNMFFCVKQHIIIFKEKFLQIIVYATSGEFDDSLFLCPKASERNLRVRGSRDLSKLLIVEHMTSQRFSVTPHSFHINTNRNLRHHTCNGCFAMGEIEMDGRCGACLSEKERRFAMLANLKQRLFGNAIRFTQSPTKK